MTSKTVTTTAQETEKLGGEFAQQLKPGDIVFLSGELGAGKTTFVKGVARGLGSIDRIISPTFTIVRQHEVKGVRGKGEGESKQIQKLYHIDLYRLDGEQEIESIGLDDILNDETGVAFIEWPEKLKGSDFEPTYTIRFKQLADDKRSIIMTSS